MARHEAVKVSQIVYHPTYRPERSTRGDMIALTQEISSNGMTTPILVDEEYTLLDGARRLSLYGPDDVVRIYVAENIVEAVLFLEEIKGKDGQDYWDPRRIWDLHISLKYLRDKNIRLIKSLGNNRHGKIPYVPKGRDQKNFTRNGITTSTGVSQHYVQSITFMYSRHEGIVPVAPEDRPLLDELIADLDSGGNAYTAVGLWHKHLKEKQQALTQATGLADQRNLLMGAVANIKTVARALEELGPIHSGIKPEDAEHFRMALYNAKRVVNTAILKLREREIRN